MHVIERLSSVSLIWILASRVRSRSTAPKPRLFMEPTWGGRMGARLLSKMFGVAIAEADYRQIQIRDSVGRLVFQRVLSQDIDDELRKVLADPSYRPAFSRLAARGRLLPFTIKALADFDLLTPRRAQQFVPALLIVQIARWLADRVKTDDPAELWLCRRPWGGPLERYAAEHHITIHWAPPRMVWASLGLYPFGPETLAVLRRLQFAVPRANTRRRAPVASCAAAGPAATVSPSIGVAYRGHANLARPEKHSELLFVDGQSVHARDVLVVFEEKGPRPTQAVCAALSGQNVRAVMVNGRHGALPGVSNVQLPAPVVTSEAGAILGREVRLPRLERRWIAQQVWQYERLVREWRHVVEASGIRILITWYKYDGTHAAIADALDACDGALALYQRAYEGWSSPMTAVFADVMFGWSSWTADVERRSGSQIEHFVTTGFLGDHRFALLLEPAARMRAQLAVHGARRIIAYFDENSHDDERWLFGHGITRTAYAELLERVLRYPWLGMVLKPKHPATLRTRLGPVSDLLERALATGRCHLYEDGSGATVPAEAALSADVAIHGHLQASTAAVEAALAGVPTLIMDFEGVPDHRLNVLGVGEVVFREWSSAWAACEDIWTTGSRAVRDRWGGMLDELDPFRDGRANLRMAAYLGWTLEAFRRGARKRDALGEASEQYGRKWGRDKVLSIGGERGAVHGRAMSSL